MQYSSNQVINKTELGAKLVGILAGMIALIAFIFDINQDHKARRADRVDLWRKAAIQELLQEADDNTLGIRELLSRMRNSAWDEDELDILKDDLIEKEVRVLLLEMIAMGILEQRPQDIYRLRFRNNTIDKESFVEGYREGRALEKFRFNLPTIVAMIISKPNYYTRRSLFDEIFRDRGVDESLFNSFMDEMVEKGSLLINREGKMQWKSIGSPYL